MVPVLKKGCKAYYDTFSGLIPCQVVSINGNMVEFKLNKTIAAYRKGEVLKSSANWVVPKDAIVNKKYSKTIRYYQVIPDC
jgi:hypothetical protein